MRYELKNNEFIVFLEGRIDANSVDEVEKEVTDLLDSNPHESFCMDCEKLDYISSAGLRMVLRKAKKEKNMRIVGVNSEVYEIFEMTGFVEFLPIEKAYRHLSIDGCEVIGRGANGTVYRYDPETIIKVYPNPDSLPDIQRERALAREAFVLGIPTAISYDVVKVDDKFGSVFELLNADSLAKLIVNDPDHIDKYAKEFVNLMKQMHSTETKSELIPDMKEIVQNWVQFLKDYLPSDSFEKLKALVDAVPQSACLIHGDYHTRNVMVQNGEVLLIDMDTLAKGHGIFELASVFNAYVGFSVLNHSEIERFQGFDFQTGQYFWKKTLELYFDTTDPEVLQMQEDKASLIGYARLMRRSIRRGGLDTPEGQEQIEFYKQQIIEKLNRVETLEF